LGDFYHLGVLFLDMDIQARTDFQRRAACSGSKRSQLLALSAGEVGCRKCW
jgi:hypothetical protein